ncbi:MAG: penicillin-binding protein 2 [Bradymonadia bacterium]
MSLVFQEVDSTRRRRRIIQFSLIVCLSFGGLFFRLVDLQLFNGDQFAERAVKNFIRRAHIEAKRGRILDAKGRPLAMHQPTYKLNINARKVTDPEALISELVTTLSLNDVEASKLKESIVERKANRDRRAVKLDRPLSRQDVAKIEALGSIQDGISIQTSYERVYPNGSVGAHLIGYMGLVSAKELKNDDDKRLRPTSRVGRFGIERKFEEVLAGRPGFRQFAVDARGRRVTASWVQPHIEGFVNQRSATRGQDVVLTINQDVQRILHRRLKSVQSGAAIVLNIHSGDILGMVSHPGFDPNEWSRGLTRIAKEKIDKNPYNPMVDKSVHAYFPGSLYKIVTAYAAMEEEIIAAVDYVESPGAYEFGQRVFHCHKRSGHGRINLSTALAASADVYFYKLGERLGIDILARYARSFGFGKRTAVGLNGEQAGVVPTRDFHESATPGGYQHGLSLSTAVGQGDVRTSPLQIAVAYAAIANGGKLIQPRLVTRIQDVNETLSRHITPQVEAVLQPKNTAIFDDIRLGLYRAVWDDKRGTALNAQSSKIRMSGKTGTAQVRQLSRGFNRQTVTEFKHRDHAWFAGYVPARSPEWVIVVFLEHGGSGGKNAAPMARRMIEEIHQTMDLSITRHSPQAGPP